MVHSLTFVPCSPRHERFCSPAHAALVRGYVEERQRQEIAHDGLWNAYGTGEYEDWRENGGKLIDFRTWLRAHKGANR